MNGIEQAQLTDGVTNILEKMAFVLCEDAEEPRWDNDDYQEHVYLTLQGGGEHAAVLLSADQPFLVELASSILGVMPDDLGAEQAGMALLELGNVVAGEVVQILGGAFVEYDLSLPKAIAATDLGSLPGSLGAAECRSCVESDDGYLRVLVAAIS